jgi:hypothetical protein
MPPQRGSAPPRQALSGAPLTEGQSTLSPAQLIASWNPAESGTPHRRLVRLLAASANLDKLSEDTLGDRNRRLLALHRALLARALEGRVTCADCGVDSEFIVPVETIMGLPAADASIRTTVRSGRRRFTFRLPRMADVDAIEDGLGADEVRREILERCGIGGDGGDVPELVARRLGARFEALDPAADIVVRLACSGCGRRLAASVDVAGFVARDLDRLVEGLLRDVDTIAAAYGWGEERILALPAWRRRRYVELIVSARSPRRSALVAGSR